MLTVRVCTAHAHTVHDNRFAAAVNGNINSPLCYILYNHIIYDTQGVSLYLFIDDCSYFYQMFCAAIGVLGDNSHMWNIGNCSVNLSISTRWHTTKSVYLLTLLLLGQEHYQMCHHKPHSEH